MCTRTQRGKPCSMTPNTNAVKWAAVFMPAVGSDRYSGRSVLSDVRQVTEYDDESWKTGTPTRSNRWPAAV